MTLENQLKHYLPYNLKCEILDYRSDYVGDQYETMKGYYLLNDKAYFNFKPGRDYAGKNITQFKPILRPLKDLANEIEINGNAFYPLGSLLVQKYPKWFVENNGSAKYTHITIDFSGRFATAFLTYQATHKIQIDSTYIKNTSYLVFQKLLEWHFDVFGLIEKGMAIDINDVSLAVC